MPADAIKIKPVIREIARTQVCFPDIKLLIDRIYIIKLPDADEAAGQEAYCLHLTDREKTIQAVIKRRLHRAINKGEIREGSFVVLKDYQLARGKRLVTSGEVIYLKIADFYSVGEEYKQDEKVRLLETPRNTRPSSEPLQGASLSDSSPKLNAQNRAVAIETKESTCPPGESSTAKPPAQSGEDVKLLPRNQSTSLNTLRKSQKRRGDMTFSELKSNAGKRRQLENSNLAYTQEVLSEPHNRVQTLKGLSPITDTPTGIENVSERPDVSLVTMKEECGKASVYSAAQDSRAASEPLCTTLDVVSNVLAPIERPLKISALASVTGVNRCKNEIHDFLALITQIDGHTYKPPRMPRKRDLKIMDTSTNKRVVLSVFTDPTGFEPKPGTLAVFRNLMTHDWDDGNLKAYPWLCEGKAWFMPIPDDGLLDEVGRLDIQRLKELRASIMGSTLGSAS